jgi:hypothetical protein
MTAMTLVVLVVQAHPGFWPHYFHTPRRRPLLVFLLIDISVPLWGLLIGFCLVYGIQAAYNLGSTAVGIVIGVAAAFKSGNHGLWNRGVKVARDSVERALDCELIKTGDGDVAGPGVDIFQI